MKQVIDWFEIPVRDMSRAQAFYEAVLQTPLHRENFAGTNMQIMVFEEDVSRGKGAMMTDNLALQVGGCFRPLRRSAALINPDAFVCVSHDFKVMREAWQKPWR